MSGYPPRLAVATKPGKRLVRVLLYELLGGGSNGLPQGATAMCTGQAQITDSLSIKVLLDMLRPLRCPYHGTSVWPVNMLMQIRPLAEI